MGASFNRKCKAEDAVNQALDNAPDWQIEYPTEGSFPADVLDQIINSLTNGLDLAEQEADTGYENDGSGCALKTMKKHDLKINWKCPLRSKDD